jgi:hypothetical protein
MNRIAMGGLLGAMACVLLSGAPQSPSSAAIEIQTEVVRRFFSVYEAAGGHPTAEQLQRDYLDLGTAGLRHLARIATLRANASPGL